MQLALNYLHRGCCSEKTYVFVFKVVKKTKIRIFVKKHH